MDQQKRSANNSILKLLISGGSTIPDKWLTPHRIRGSATAEYPYVVYCCTDEKGNAADGKVKAEINQDAIKKDLMLAGYNLFVTSEIKMKAEDIYSTYHNLWRIEESFKVMKSYLDARPVYLQKTASIHGHFLICYITILLFRLLQFKVLNNK